MTDDEFEALTKRATAAMERAQDIARKRSKKFNTPLIARDNADGTPKYQRPLPTPTVVREKLDEKE